MDWKPVGINSLIVFGILSLSGFIISLLSSYLQCSKTNFLQSGKQGLIMSALPTLVYAAAAKFQIISNPFVHTFNSFNVKSSEVYGIGYLVMIVAWISAVSVVHSTEKSVCVADVNEMTEFKTKMLAELQAKEEEKAKNEKV
jgi:hypothetical protein